MNKRTYIVETLKNYIRKTEFCRYLMHRRSLRELAEWKIAGRPSPPPYSIKHRAILAYSDVYDLHVFVETGTFYGTTADAVKPFFEEIYTIELDPLLYAVASKRFDYDAHVKVFHGDSGKELGTVMRLINRPSIFWLDAHYSAGVTARGDKDTPILEELDHILDSPDMGHVILIDDMHEFGANPAYPTIEQLTRFVHSKRTTLKVAARHNIIRIVPE